jgi:cell division protein FtsQ
VNFDTTASRFLRPTDVARLRRNQRRVNVQRLLVVLRNVALVAALAGSAIWMWQRTQSDARFAVKTIQLEGVVHTPMAAMSVATDRYKGLNLFQIDIDRVQRDLGGLGWVNRIEIEKKVPDTLRIKVTERTPVALARVASADKSMAERLLYVDEKGVAFAELSPRVGNDDLPIITDAHGPELQRTVNLLRHLRAKDRELYSRISEVWPIAPRGFALYDRDLGAVVYANADDISEKYRNLYAILQSESNPKIEYADLRFADRVIVKPTQVVPSGAREPLDQGILRSAQDDTR